MDFFTAEKLSPRVTRIRDILQVGMYLVEGDYSACLIDTGYGLGNVRDFVESLTDKPVFVILTHGHVDHAGAASLWDEVWLSPLDLDVYAQHSDLGFRRRHFEEHEETKWIPENEYVPARTGPFLSLYDGQVFHLGGVTLEMIGTPGHTPGMTMVLIREERMIIFGDGCGLQVLLIFPDSGIVSEYRRTLLKLKKYEDFYDRILRNHGTCESPKELLDNCIDCCTDILAGTDAAEKVNFGEIKAFSARALDGNLMRADGRQGNIWYTEDKRR